jgi:TonB family protein
MGSFTTEVPSSAPEAKSKRGGTDALEAEAIGLDIAVRIHGSQVTAVVLDTTEHVEPFEEDTSTMIVFPRGAVVKLRARVRTGHAVVLTHLASKQTALCRIVQVNSAMNVAHYVKLEFIQPEPGFWGVHFPSDAQQPAAKQQEHPLTAEPPESSAKPVAPAQSATANVPSIAQTLPSVEAPRTVAKPLEPEPAKESVKPAPAPLNYGISEDLHSNEVVPLAAAPPKRAPIAPKIQAPVPPQPIPPKAQAPVASRRTATPATEAPIFDSLSTGEEVFGKEPVEGAAAEVTGRVKSDRKATQLFVRSMEGSSLLGKEPTPKRHTGAKIFLSVAAVVTLAAGGVFYMRQYRRSVRQNLSATAPIAMPQKSLSAAAPTTPTQTVAELPTPAAIETSSPTETPANTKTTPIQAAPERSTITVVPARSRARKATAESHAVISNGTANIYAGDLSARPQVTPHNNVAVSAPLPTIDTAPKELTSTSANAGINSLVGGVSSNLPTPPKPEAAPIVRGGQVTPPRLLRSVQPTYPPLANSNHVEGDVEIQAVIDQTGKVTSAKAISGPMLLRSAAMDAVRQWRYSPASLDGKPITVEYKVTVRFRLSE